MAISLNNFVNVNFEAKRYSALVSSYPMSVIISKEAQKDGVFESLDDFQAVYSTTTTELYKAALVYFENGGNTLMVAKREADDTISQVLDRIKDQEFIFFYCSDTVTDVEAQAVGTQLESLKAPNKKIYCITDSNENAKDSGQDTTLSSKLANFNYVAMKYSTKTSHAATAIMAYFSNINLNGTNTVKDYAKTSERVIAEDLSDTEYNTLMSRNYNVTTKVGNKYEFNCGGNLSNGVAIEEQFGLIAIENDIVSTLMTFLLTKPAMVNASLTSIQVSVQSVLARYTTNGLLRPDAIYTGTGEAVSYNGRNYPLITTNTILTPGYVVYVLPLTALTDNDKATKTAPPVYVYLSVAGTIRKVNVEGVAI